VNRRFAVVYEASADFQTATELADRVLVESIDWMEAHLLDHQRSWIREWGGQPLTWTRIGRSARDAGIRAKGHFDGEPALEHAQAARRAIRYLREAVPELAGILLIRDQDDKPERRLGFEQARREAKLPPAIIVGLAVVEREAWVISGFEPEGEAEEAVLATERQRLGFDPRMRSEQLTDHKADTAPRSPKHVLRELCRGDHERECRCWSVTPLETLRRRGANNGLGAFLDEVRSELAVLIGRVS
jgi:hypothetical protein